MKPCSSPPLAQTASGTLAAMSPPPTSSRAADHRPVRGERPTTATAVATPMRSSVSAQATGSKPARAPAASRSTQSRSE